MKRAAVAVAVLLAVTVPAGAATKGVPIAGTKCTAARWGETAGPMTCALVAPDAYAWVQPAPTPKAADPLIEGDASEIADVTQGKCSASFGLGKLLLTIRNSSSKRSNYSVETVFLDAAGNQIGDGLAFVQNVAPGATAKTDAGGFITEGAKVASCRIVKVDRTAA